MPTLLLGQDCLTVNSPRPRAQLHRACRSNFRKVKLINSGVGRAYKVSPTQKKLITKKK